MDPTDLKDATTGAAIESGKSMLAATRGEKNDGKDELMKLNQLHYRIPPSLSLVTKRTLTKSFFQQQQYPNISTRQIVMTINTGEFYISAPTSFLVLTVGINRDTATTGLTGTATVTGDNPAYALLANGDVLNLVDEVIFQSASGTEIAREQEKGLCNALIQRAMVSQEFLNTAGETSGWPGGTLRECYDAKGWAGTAGAGALNQPGFLYPLRNKTYVDLTQTGTPTGTTAQLATSYGTTTGSVDISYSTNAVSNPSGPKTFIVPMKRVLSCFAPYMNALFPAAALAGGVLTIRFKNATESLIAAGSYFGSTPSTALTSAKSFLDNLSILNCYILWDSFQLNDSVLKRLNEISASKSGLSVMFDCWDWAQSNTSTLTTEAQVSQARSIISRSLCVVRDQAQRTNPFCNSLASEAAITRETGYDNQYIMGGAVQPVVDTYQAQLGSLYFPQQPLETPEEYCMNLYYVLNKNYIDSEEVSSVTLDDFYGAQGKGQYSGSFPSIVPLPPQTGTYIGDRYIYTKGNLPPWCQNWGNALYGFIAERSQLLQLTGLPISNARLLRHKFTFNVPTKSGSPRIIDVFTQYARVMKVFLGGRVVMRE